MMFNNTFTILQSFSCPKCSSCLFALTVNELLNFFAKIAHCKNGVVYCVAYRRVFIFSRGVVMLGPKGGGGWVLMTSASIDYQNTNSSTNPPVLLLHLAYFR